MKKTYIVLGDNNYWYSSIFNVTLEEAQKELDIVIEQISNNEFTDNEPGKPQELFLYEATLIKTANYKEPDEVTENELSEQLHGVYNNPEVSITPKKS